MNKNNQKYNIHLVGIGGIGMSGIAKIFALQGHKVSGCDSNLNQKTIQELISLGCLITTNYRNKSCQYFNNNINNLDIIVYSSSIKQDHPELNLELNSSLNNRNIKIIHRSKMLNELMRNKTSIAVTGSHGKTTTSALISHILLEAKTDSSIIIGGELNSIQSNAQLGSGDFLVAEADESDKSFLNLHPDFGVITNIDLEHFETYKNLAEIQQAFLDFINNISIFGSIYLGIDNDNICQIINKISNTKIVTFGLTSKANYYAKNIKLGSRSSKFDLYKNNKYLSQVTLNIPGEYNIINALGAYSLADQLNIPLDITIKALGTFSGIDRRFSYKGLYKNAELFDDYAHHPVEINNALKTASQIKKNKLTVVFQPHKYSRTQSLWSDFVDIFKSNNIDNLIITDIYPAGEDKINNITSENLVKAISQDSNSVSAKYIPEKNNFQDIINYLEVTTKNNDLILFLGAGHVNKVITSLLNK